MRSVPLGRGEPFGYVNQVVFENADPAQRQQECDALRTLALHYAVPFVTVSHRLGHHGPQPSLDEADGAAEVPIPVTIDAELPNLPVQSAVALSLSNRGFFATLENACPVGGVIRVAFDTPRGPITTRVVVHDVQTTRVGSFVVHQHDFHWQDRSALRPLLAHRKRWASAIARANRHRRRLVPAIGRIAAMQLAACVLVAVTVFFFGWVHREDVVLAGVARGPIAADTQDKLRRTFDRPERFAKAPTGRLLRVYKAASTVGNDAVAAEAARHLADRVKRGRCTWC